MQEVPSDEEHVILCSVIFLDSSLQMFFFKVIWGIFMSDKETASIDY